MLKQSQCLDTCIAKFGKPGKGFQAVVYNFMVFGYKNLVHQFMAEGSFPGILSVELFESVQAVLKRKAHSRKSGKETLAFPLAGLLTCGECGCAITACNITNRHGKLFRYYRCTKKKGKCSQGCLQESQLAAQLKLQLQKVAIPNDWTDKMLEQVLIWEKEENNSAQKYVQEQKDALADIQDKLNRLVGAYIDQEIPKETYLVKKEELLKQKVALTDNLKSFRQTGKTWVKPLRQWVIDAKQATFVACSDDLTQIKRTVQKVGLNPQFLDKKIKMRFRPPFDLTAEILAQTAVVVENIGSEAAQKNLKNPESFPWWRCRELNPGPKHFHLPIVHKISLL